MEIELVGNGRAVVFRDGERFEGTWTRNNRHDLLTFQDINGDPLPLQVGNSWIQVIPNWYEDPVSSE